MPPKSAAQTLPVTAPAEDAFYIAATQSVSRPRRSLKSNDTFIVLDTHGDMGAAAGGTDGLFSPRHALSLSSRASDQRRAAAAARLECARRQRSARRRPHQSGLLRRQRVILEKDTLHILRTIFLWRDTAYQRFGVRNYGDRPIDAADGDSVRQRLRRPVRGARHAPRHDAVPRPYSCAAADQVLSIYHGLDDKLRRTTLTFDPPPNDLATNGALYELDARAGRVAADLPGGRAATQHESRPVPFLRALLAARRELRAASAAIPRSRLRTSFSTRCCAAPPPISPCS